MARGERSKVRGHASSTRCENPSIHDAPFPMLHATMKRAIHLSILWAAGSLLLPLQAAPGEIIAPGATVQKLSSAFQFTEGPAVDRQGNVYFTDQPNDRILKWSSADSSISTFLQPAGRANGMYFDRQGNLIACADENNQLWSIAPSGKVAVLVKDYQGKLLNGPNDVWVRPDNGLYFTDPLYQRPYWKRGPMEQRGQH